MQGLHDFVPTERKVAYIQQLLAVGFDVLDVGSFVSPKAIPQMADTAQVLRSLDLSRTNTKLLVIVANTRGAQAAVEHERVDYLGYPFSVSETFQLRNTNATIDESYERLERIIELCRVHGKGLVVYLSMGFGNPYGDAWNVGIVAQYARELIDRGVSVLQLSDTIGVSTPASIGYLFEGLSATFPEVTFGAHLHTTPDTWREKVEAAYAAGCRRFDGAIAGYGGCPMAADKLTGNMPTERLIDYLHPRGAGHIDLPAFERARAAAVQLFPAL